MQLLLDLNKQLRKTELATLPQMKPKAKLKFSVQEDLSSDHGLTEVQKPNSRISLTGMNKTKEILCLSTHLNCSCSFRTSSSVFSQTSKPLIAFIFF